MKDIGTIKDRGFASLTVKRHREIASLGGKAAQAKGTGRRWTAAEAKRAGEIGRANQAAKRAVQS